MDNVEDGMLVPPLPFSPEADALMRALWRSCVTAIEDDNMTNFKRIEVMQDAVTASRYFLARRDETGERFDL